MEKIKYEQKKYKIRYLIATLISLLPFNFLRTFFYRVLMGYRIKKTFISFGTKIAVNSLFITSSKIGRNNIFYGPMDVKINHGTIGSKNNFKTELWVFNNKFSNKTLTKKLIIEEKTLITDLHFFDIVGTIIIGKNTWIAGKNSEFWTHGLGVSDKNISIGENCYIGSSVLFAPGTEIKSNTVISMGSFVKGKFLKEKVLLQGNPAQIVKENYNRHLNVTY